MSGGKSISAYQKTARHAGLLMTVTVLKLWRTPHGKNVKMKLKNKQKKLKLVKT